MVDTYNPKRTQGVPHMILMEGECGSWVRIQDYRILESENDKMSKRIEELKNIIVERDAELRQRKDT